MAQGYRGNTMEGEPLLIVVFVVVAGLGFRKIRGRCGVI